MTAANVELDSVKGKIRALAAKTIENGCTEAEANLAMETVGRLLDRYNLSMDAVMLRDEACVTAHYYWGQKQKPPVSRCAVAIARFCDCHVWGATIYDDAIRDYKRAYSYFGMESDTQMAIYLTDVIAKAIETELAKYKRTDPIYLSGRVPRKTLSSSFTHGITSRIFSRLEDMKRQRDAETLAERARAMAATPQLADRTTTDIVALKQDRVEEELKKTGRKVKYITLNRRTGSMSAYHTGEAAGNNVNLNRPISSGGRPVGLLG